MFEFVGCMVVDEWLLHVLCNACFGFLWVTASLFVICLYYRNTVDLDLDIECWRWTLLPMNRWKMSDSDDDILVFVVLMDYYLNKILAVSRVPGQISAFNSQYWVVELLVGHDDVFFDILWMTKDCFLSLCHLLAKQGLQETMSISVQEQVMLFLTVVGHCDSNRRSAYEWRHSGETISRHFNNVCSHIVRLTSTLIGPPDFGALSPIIAKNQNFFLYFEVRTYLVFMIK